MVDLLLHFVDELRGCGLRVTTSEALDAVRATEAISVADRDRLRDALRACLVKRAEDVADFDAAFEAFFAVRLTARGKEPGRGIAVGGFGSNRQSAAATSTTRTAKQPRPLPSAPPSSAPSVQPSTQSPAAHRQEHSAFDPDAAPRQGVPFAAEDLREALLRRRRIDVREDLNRVREASQVRRAPQRLDARLSSDEVRQLEREIDKIADSLRTRPSRRYRHGRHGQLNLKRTMAASARTGGIPFHIYRRHPRLRKHDVVVLCDVSGSMRQVARLLLRLVYGLQARFSRVASFLFIDRMLEVSRTFDVLPFDQAVADLQSAPGFDFDAYSDYGRAFTEFHARHLQQVGSRTVLLVMGDARSNYYDPGTWAFEEIARRAWRVIWLNPEPQSQWDRDDSVASGYRPCCDDYFECGTLEQLARAAASLRAAMNR